MLKKSLDLSNGVSIPQIALGVWQVENKKVVDVVKTAIKVGYRHIDTALVYENEVGVGEAIRNSGLERNEFLLPQKFLQK